MLRKLPCACARESWTGARTFVVPVLRGRAPACSIGCGRSPGRFAAAAVDGVQKARGAHVGGLPRACGICVGRARASLLRSLWVAPGRACSSCDGQRGQHTGAALKGVPASMRHRWWRASRRLAASAVVGARRACSSCRGGVQEARGGWRGLALGGSTQACDARAGRSPASLQQLLPRGSRKHAGAGIGGRLQACSTVVN